MEVKLKAGDSLNIPEGCKAYEESFIPIPRRDRRIGYEY